MWGRPNSVTIIGSSMRMAAEIEFGNFLTMIHTLRIHLPLSESPFFSNRTNLLPTCAMERGQFLGSAYEWLRLSILLADYTLLYELLDVVGHLGPKYSVRFPKEASLLTLVSLMYVLEHFWSHLLWYYDMSNES